MTRPECPINWTEEDGICPCAFLKWHKICMWNGICCIPMHMKRYMHATKFVEIPCDQCSRAIKTTQGKLDAFSRFGKVEHLCPECHEEKYAVALAAHIRGCL